MREITVNSGGANSRLQSNTTPLHELVEYELPVEIADNLRACVQAVRDAEAARREACLGLLGDSVAYVSRQSGGGHSVRIGVVVGASASGAALAIREDGGEEVSYIPLNNILGM